MKSLMCFVLTIAALATASCAREEVPGAPSPVLVVEVKCPEFGESSRCSAFSMVGGRDGQDVTGLATWSTGDPAIATVSSGGLVTARVAGEVSIRASYQDATGFAIVWAIPGAGLHGTFRALEGTVLSLGGPLPGVVMEILTGPNAGRRTTTSSTGRFFMDDLRDGQFAIRLSKPGYETASYVWSIPGGRERSPTLTASR